MLLLKKKSASLESHLLAFIIINRDDISLGHIMHPVLDASVGVALLLFGLATASFLIF